MRPVTCSVNDWSHVFVVGGIAQIEVWLFLSKARELELLQFSGIDRYFQQWHWPASCHNPPRCFSEARMRSCSDSDENKLKCGASEFLDMYPIFEHMVQTWDLKAVMEAEVASLLSMFLTGTLT